MSVEDAQEKASQALAAVALVAKAEIVIAAVETVIREGCNRKSVDQFRQQVDAFRRWVESN